MLILIVAGGPDKGRIYELFDDREVILGREGADLQFTDVKVSRRHARIWCDGGRWYIQDLESKHGTHRNHQEIEDLQPLKDGDYIQVGRTVMVLARMSAEHLQHAALASPLAAKGSGRAIKAKHLIAASAAAALLLLGINVASLVSASRGTTQLQERLAALGQETPMQKELRSEVRLAMEAKADHERKLENMLAAFGPKTDRLMPKLDTILATLDAQPDVVGPLTALASAIESRNPGDQLNAKIDSALALLEARGGDAEALADQFRQMLAQQPTIEQLAAATQQNDAQTTAVLANIVAKLDRAAAPDPFARSDAMSEELAELRRLIEARPTEDHATQQLKPLLERVLAQVENHDSADDTQTLLAAIAEVKSVMPADNSETLGAMLAQLGRQPTGDDLAAVNQQLATLSLELRDRKDAQLIQEQLAALIESSNGRVDADRALVAASDPLLGQLLVQVEALAENDKKLDSILASLKQQPYDNRAMLDEALAQLGDGATDETVAQLLDQTMAELRGKSITDADQLRRLIQREVVAAVGEATGQPADRQDEDTRLTKTETAYKLAFESGKKITIGVTRDAATNRPVSGRILDPADAIAAGHASWRDWYLMDDLANRMQLEDEAMRVARGQSREPRILRLPEMRSDDPEMNVSASPVAE